MEDKLRVTCSIDNDIDESSSVRCDIFKDDKKIGDYNLDVNPNKRELNFVIKGKELIDNFLGEDGNPCRKKR